MSIKQFKFLLHAIRFDNIRTRQQRRAQDKLAPVRFIFDEFVSYCKNYYIPSEFVTVDEMLDPFCGRCSFRQYNPKKPARYGIKLFALCDAKTFYTSNLEVYTGVQPEGPYKCSNSSKEVVFRMIAPISRTGRHLTLDNWYGSIPLVRELLENHGLTAVCTLKKNKPEIPPSFIDDKIRQVSSILFGYQQDLTLLSYIPRKGKVVLLLSSLHHTDEIDEDTGEKRKPVMLTCYNKYKGGVDTVDHMKSACSVARKTNRWSLVIFFTLLNIGGINSYVILRSNIQEKAGNRRDFIKSIIKELCKEHLNRRASIPKIPTRLRYRIRELTGQPVRPALDEENGPRTGRCYLCGRVKNRKSQTRCSQCRYFICREHTRFACVECAGQRVDEPSTEEDESGNDEHMKLVNDMGITVATLADGRVQLLHTFSNAKSVSDAEEGLLFMQEMVELSKSQAAETQPQSISFYNQGELITLSAGPAHFGRQMRGSDNVSARVGVANPLRACDTLTNPEWLRGRIAIVERGDCMFVEKARRLVLAGAVGGIVVDNVPESSSGASPMFAMSGDGKDDVPIPVVFLFSQDAWKLLQALAYDPTTVVTIADRIFDKEELKAKKDPVQPSTLQQIKGSVQKFLFSSESDTSSEDKPDKYETRRSTVSLKSSDLPLVEVAAVTGEGVDIGDLSGGQGMIRISRRDAYFSSEGTAVIPPFYREHLRKLLLEMLAKPQSEKWLKEIASEKEQSLSESDDKNNSNNNVDDNDDSDDISNSSSSSSNSKSSSSSSTTNNRDSSDSKRDNDDLVQVGITSRSRIGRKFPDEL